MMLNLGCGDQYVQGWNNVDWVGCPYLVDESADLREPLPWRDATHVYAGHLLEHMYVGDCIDFLVRLQDCMAPGGELMVVGPDMLVAECLAGSRMLHTNMNQLRYGANRWPGDEHHWDCAEPDVVALLRLTGWNKVTPVPLADIPEVWPVADRDAPWQCAVSAVAA